MYTGMCTLSGTSGASAEIAILESTSTNRVARPISSPFMAEVVVASVGHIPRTRTKVGLSLTNPLVTKDHLLIS